MGTKQVMVTAPLVVLLYDRTFLAGTFREAWRRRWGLYLGLAATWLILAPRYLALGSFFLERPTAGPAGLPQVLATPWEYLRSQPGVVTHYLYLAFWPRSLCLDYDWPVAETAREILPPAIFVIALLGLTLWAARRRPTLGFLGLWFFLILAPTSSVVPTQDLAFEHRLYLPLAAVVTAAVVGAYALGRALICHGRLARPGAVVTPASTAGQASRGRRLLGWGLAAGVLTAVTLPLGYRTVLRNADYRSPLTLWQDTVQQRPDNPRAHCNLGVAFAATAKKEEAMLHFGRAIDLKPNYALAYVNRGSAWQDLRQFDRAIEDYTRAIELNPGYAEIYANRGSAYEQIGRTDDALRDYAKALELNPGSALAYYNRGTLHKHQGRDEEALRDFSSAIRVCPTYVPAYDERSHILLRRSLFDLAIEDLNRVIQLNPRRAEAYYDRAEAHRMLTNYDEAIRDYSRVIRLKPDDAAAYNNRAICWFTLRQYDKAWADVKACRTLGVQVHPGFLEALSRASGRSE
jgi:tetratricopeptide (TPR) repeat protein